MPVALALMLLTLEPVKEVFKKPWETGHLKYSATEYAYMEFRHQIIRDVPAYRIAGMATYDRWLMDDALLLGDMLYHAPLFLGPRAAVFAVSCNTCHPGGASHNTLYIESSADRPGNIDLLWEYFYTEPNDGVFSPRNISSLRGAKTSGPYRRDGTVATLAEANKLVVTHEFQQKSVNPAWLEALSAYVERFELHPSPYLDAEGRLNEKATEPARAGELVFDAPRDAFQGKSCSTCHVKATEFTDHQQHALWHGASTDTIAPTKAFDTPGLLDSAETAPYFFDGSAWTLEAAVEHIDKKHGLQLSPADKSSLAAYLAAVGAIEKWRQGWTSEERVRQALAWGRLGETADEKLWPILVDTMRLNVTFAIRDGSPPATTAWRKLVTELRALAAAPPTPEARARLRALITPEAQALLLLPAPAPPSSATAATATRP